MAKTPMTELSATHIVVLHGLALGKSREAIRDDLHYSNTQAIAQNLEAIIRILNAKNPYNAIYIATKRGLI